MLGDRAPAAVAQLENLAALGVGRFLSLGTAGGLGVHQKPGDVVVLSGAVRDEGASYHYVDVDVDAVPDTALTVDLASALACAGIASTYGRTWTIDAPYRQSVEEISEFRRRGVLTVEMEASALFVVASVRGLHLASAVVLDGVFGEPIGPQAWMLPRRSGGSTNSSSSASTYSRHLRSTLASSAASDESRLPPERHAAKAPGDHDRDRPVPAL